MAPPRLRSKLKSPLALGTASGDKCPRARRIGGNRQNMNCRAANNLRHEHLIEVRCARLKRAQSQPQGENAKAEACQQACACASLRSATASGAISSWAAPVTIIVWPISKAE